MMSENEEWYDGLARIGDEISWEPLPISDVWVPCEPGDYPVMLVTYDRDGGRRIYLRPFGHLGDVDLCVRILRRIQ